MFWRRPPRERAFDGDVTHVWVVVQGMHAAADALGARAFGALSSSILETCTDAVEGTGGQVVAFSVSEPGGAWYQCAWLDDGGRARAVAEEVVASIAALPASDGLAVAAGVHRGSALVMMKGDAMEMVLGDSVNQVIRLARAADPGEVLGDA